MISALLVLKDAESVAIAVLEKSTPADKRGNLACYTGTNTLLSQAMSVATVIPADEFFHT